jgi:GDP-L-fucose synthase
MPTNLYGLGDNYHPDNSHVIPGLVRKFHEAKTNNLEEVVVWGTGKPYREFLFSDDMALGCIFLMNLPDEKFRSLLAVDRNDGLPPVLNMGTGSDLTIAELAALVKSVVKFEGDIVFNPEASDGTPRKLMDSGRLNRLGWQANTSLETGLATAYQDFRVNVAK